MACIFCDIVAGKVETELLYEDEQVIAFNDLNPQAPIHVLIIPKQHIETVNDLTAEHQTALSHMYQAAKQLAEQFGLSEAGYRLVMNCNTAGGQSVYHIHLHLLGGRQMQWPPG